MKAILITWFLLLDDGSSKYDLCVHEVCLHEEEALYNRKELVIAYNIYFMLIFQIEVGCMCSMLHQCLSKSAFLRQVVLLLLMKT